MLNLIFVLLAQSLAMLVLVLPIIFPFSTKKNWISQLFMLVVSLVLVRKHLSSLYYRCDASNDYAAGHGFGDIIFTYFTFLILATFVFNIVMRFVRSKFKVNFMDVAIVLVLAFTTWQISNLYEHPEWEGRCEKIEPMARLFLITPKEKN